MIIRTATPDDARGISAVLTALVDAGLRKNRADIAFALHNYITDPDRIECSVAVLADEILGFQSLKRAITGNPYDVTPGWGIIGTHISPDAARRGVGTALFAATRRAARAAGLTDIDAAIGADNKQGLAYYEAMGFQTYRRMDGAICKRFRV